jgi:hypothetical protein
LKLAKSSREIVRSESITWSAVMPANCPPSPWSWRWRGPLQLHEVIRVPGTHARHEVVKALHRAFGSVGDIGERGRERDQHAVETLTLFGRRVDAVDQLTEAIARVVGIAIPRRANVVVSSRDAASARSPSVKNYRGMLRAPSGARQSRQRLGSSPGRDSPASSPTARITSRTSISF